MNQLFFPHGKYSDLIFFVGTSFDSIRTPKLLSVYSTVWTTPMADKRIEQNHQTNHFNKTIDDNLRLKKRQIHTDDDNGYSTFLATMQNCESDRICSLLFIGNNSLIAKHNFLIIEVSYACMFCDILRDYVILSTATQCHESEILTPFKLYIHVFSDPRQRQSAC